MIDFDYGKTKLARISQTFPLKEVTAN